MKSSVESIVLISASALAGAALFKLSNASFIAALPGDVLVAVAASLAIVAFAARDYSRGMKPLRSPAKIVRPVRAANHRPRFFTYGNASPRPERIAA